MFNTGLQHLSQQQQMALLQQMAQMQMAQLGNMKSSGNQPLSMMIPGAGQFVLVPQNQIQQIQQYQDAHMRQQMHASHPEVNEFNLERELANARPDIARAMLNNQRTKQPKPLPKNGNQVNGKPNSQKNQPKALPKRVLVTKLPNHIKTVEALAEVFYPYGIISEIQIFKDRSQLTSGLVEIIAKVDPRQNSMPAATVEFETSQAAKFAVSIMRKREKQLQFRVALLKGDSVDEKHCHNYQKGARRPQMSSKAESGAETDNHSSSGYDTCSLKSESPRPNEEKAASESGVSSADYYNDHCILEDFENMSLTGAQMSRNLGPIAPPKHQMKHNKMRSDKKVGQLSRFRATYKSQQAM